MTRWLASGLHEVAEERDPRPRRAHDGDDREDAGRNERLGGRQHLLVRGVERLGHDERDADQSGEEEDGLDESAAVHGSLRGTEGAAAPEAYCLLRAARTSLVPPVDLWDPFLRPRTGTASSTDKGRTTVQSDQAHYEREREFWDQMGADDYATLSAVDRQRIVDWIGWEGDGRILDIGGGAGMVSRLLVSKAGTEVVCLDISAAMLSHSPVPAVQADAMQLPLADESFDLVVAAAFLHHLPGLEAAVLEGMPPRAQARRPVGGLRPERAEPAESHLHGRRSNPTEAIHAGRTPDRTEHVWSRKCRAASFSSFQLDFFTFRNETKTAFEPCRRTSSTRSRRDR